MSIPRKRRYPMRAVPKPIVINVSLHPNLADILAAIHKDKDNPVARNHVATCGDACNARKS